MTTKLNTEFWTVNRKQKMNNIYKKNELFKKKCSAKSGFGILSGVPQFGLIPTCSIKLPIAIIKALEPFPQESKWPLLLATRVSLIPPVSPNDIQKVVTMLAQAKEHKSESNC